MNNDNEIRALLQKQMIDLADEDLTSNILKRLHHRQLQKQKRAFWSSPIEIALICLTIFSSTASLLVHFHTLALNSYGVWIIPDYIYIFTCLMFFATLYLFTFDILYFKDSKFILLKKC